MLSPRSFAVGRAPRSFAVGLASIVPPGLRNLTFDVNVTTNMMAERAPNCNIGLFLAFLKHLGYILISASV